MNVLSPIGGFFELELPKGEKGYHPDAIALTNGRACMSWLLKNTPPSKVYVPFYSCYALFEPMEKMGIPFEFYQIDQQLNPVDLPEPKDNELVIYINFYGLKNQKLPDLINKYREKLIIDNTHCFFNQGYENAISFTSARKYFGVPDGAYLYAKTKKWNGQIPRFTNVSVNHNVKRLIGKQEEAYSDYLEYENSLGYKVKKISLLSEQILATINYNHVSQKRIDNFNYLHKELSPTNELEIDIYHMNVPFCYPFLPLDPIDKNIFYQKKIFIPTLWPDVLTRNISGYKWEKKLTQKLLPLPIDHRYGESEMKRIVEVIKNVV